MHEIKRKIIQHLKYNPAARFSEFEIEADSNKLSYHMRELEKDGLIEHKNDKYSLTNEGKKLLNFLADETSEQRKQPVCVVAMIPMDGDKVLLQKRLKEPWHGYWMLVAGRVEFGESFEQAVERELFEETSLKGEMQLAGMVSSRSYNGDKLTYHVHMYCYKIKNTQGVLKAKIKEGKNKWVDFTEVPKLDMHPVDYLMYTKKDEKFWLIEQKEYFEGENLIKTEVKSIK